MAALHCSLYFNGDRFEQTHVRVPWLIIKIQCLPSPHAANAVCLLSTNINTDTSKLIIYIRYQGLFVVVVSFPWHPPALSFFSLLCSSFVLHHRTLWAASSHTWYTEKGCSLDYWKTVAGRLPTKDFILIIRYSFTIQRCLFPSVTLSFTSHKFSPTRRQNKRQSKNIQSP